MKRIVLTAALAASSSSFAQEQKVFVFAKIVDPVLPIERGSKYEDPLDKALKKEGLGEVTGGGTMQAKDKSIQWVGIDIEVTNLERGIPLICRKLVQLGAPQGSTLEYEASGSKLVQPVGGNTCK